MAGGYLSVDDLDDTQIVSKNNKVVNAYFYGARKKLPTHIKLLVDIPVVLMLIVIMGALSAGIGMIAGYMVRIDREQQIYDKGYQQCLVDKALEGD
jgi:hypothetical protein